MTATVLTVDDSASIRGLLRLTLEGAGYEVVQAVDGRAGVDWLEAHVPDAIITDINMPRLDGFGLIEAVRGMPRLAHTPILVLSTESEGEKKDRARRAGATGWIVKPFDAPRLLQAVARVVA